MTIDLLSSLKEKLNQADEKDIKEKITSFIQSDCDFVQDISQDLPVLAEIPLSGTQLHRIATGECCTLFDGPLGVRFLLKNSFKSKYSNYVVNQFVVQVVAQGKKNTMTKEDIAVKTKVKQVIKEKEIIKKKELKEPSQVELGKSEVY